MSDFEIIHETAAHGADIFAMHESVFGFGRHARTAFRLRNGAPADLRFSYVVYDGTSLVGSVRMTPIYIGNRPAYLLGPLCIAQDARNKGLGRTLVKRCVDDVHHEDGVPVLLIGDAPYYGPLGFQRVGARVVMPGPVDPSRLLVAVPNENSDDVEGAVRLRT